MAWREITVKDVESRVTATERLSYEDTDDNDVVITDKLSDLICQVTDRIRGAIQSCRNNTSFGSAGTVPAECIYHAVSLIRHAMVGSIPNTSELQGDERDREYENAITYLSRVAECKEVISPDSGATGDTTSEAICYGSNTKMDFSII
tara:strand:- start:4157 stop:4600 length:444 start_codon:yes stop_codon:yes gene_type:complete